MDEEADKRDFVGWRHDGDAKHVTRENLAKTRDLLGPVAYDLCRRVNASRCWTNDPTLAVEIDLHTLQQRAWQHA